MRLQHRTALVTGAGSGIGRAVALEFARQGASVGIADLDAGAAATVAEQILAQGGEALPLPMDVTDEAAVDAGTEALVDRYGGLDVLFSNAGVQHIQAVAELSLADWRRVTGVHLDGAFLCTRAALRYMRPAQSGCLLYMGSVHSKEASPLKAPYVAAKHGILGLCRAVAKEEAARGIRSHVICPGFVLTPLAERQIPEQARDLGISEDEVVRKVMLKNTVDEAFTTLEEVTEVATWLASFDSLALTGQSITVSHGWHMA